MKRIILVLVVLATILALGVIPAAAQSTYQPYTVRPGDTLSSIARSHCTTTQEVYALNRSVIGPNPNAIYPGMVLNVPNRCGGSQPPPSGGVYDRGPSQHANGWVNGNIYTVVAGDTAYSVAARFGLTVNQLAAANGLQLPCWIFPGQRLVIPGLVSQPLPPCPPPCPLPLPPCQQPCPPVYLTPWPTPLPTPNPCPTVIPPQPCPSPCPLPQPCPSPSPVPSPFITITAPTSGAVLAPTFEVRGEGGGLFEGNVVVGAYDMQGVKLAEKATIIQSPTAGTGGSGPWAVTLTVNVAPGTPGKITASSPGTPNVQVASVNVVYGTASEVKDFPPGACQFQARPNSQFSSTPGGPPVGTFVGGTRLYQSTQSTKVNGAAWYRFELDPGSGNPPNWAPISSIAAYTQGCVW